MPLSREDTEYIRHAYLEGVKRGRRDAAAGTAYLGERLEGALGFSIGHVDKYSADQTQWAASKSGLARPTGRDFQRYFPKGPEDGEAWGVGNTFSNAGLTNLISLWMGVSSTSVNALGGTTSVCGVGTGTTAPPAPNTGTALLGDGSLAGAWYQPFDTTASLATTATPGQIVGTMTVGSANANIAWNEWCWATGHGAVASAGTYTLGGAFATNYAMVNRKAPVALGTKASGSSWVFSTTFSIS